MNFIRQKQLTYMAKMDSMKSTKKLKQAQVHVGHELTK